MVSRESPGVRARDPRPDGGFGLVEVLVVCAIMPIVVLAILSVLDDAARAVPRDVEWTHAIAEGRVGTAQMVRELRQAELITGATPNRVDFQVTRNGVSRRVMYACDVADAPPWRRCTRVETSAGGVLPAPATGATIVGRLENGTAADPVFSYTPDAIGPRYVGVRILVPSSGERAPELGRGHAVVLEDGAYLRNQDLGG